MKSLYAGRGEEHFIATSHLSSHFSLYQLLSSLLQHTAAAPSSKMADEVKIDKELFSNRLSHFVSAWKADKRQPSDALFGGVGSIVVLMGKNEEIPVFHKSNAMHVSRE